MKAQKTTSETPVVPSVPAKVGTVNETLKKICGELGITPKAARRKLRKAWRQKDQTTVVHTLKSRWTDADQIRLVLAPTKQ